MEKLDKDKREESFKIIYTALSDSNRDASKLRELWGEVAEYKDVDLEDWYYWAGLSDLDEEGLLDFKDQEIALNGSLEEIELEEKDMQWNIVSKKAKVDQSDVEIYTDHFKRHGFTERRLEDSYGYMFEREESKGEFLEYLLFNGDKSDEALFELRKGIQTVELTPKVSELYGKMTGNYIEKIWSQRISRLENREEPKGNQNAAAGI